MSRTPLSIGSTVQAVDGSSYTYIIDRVIGDGASSIVYEAHYIDNARGRHDVRLKECYPYASEITRTGSELKWIDSSLCTEDKVAFTCAYHKLMEFQNTTKLRNSTAHIFDLCEANGTLYSVMDVNEGKTFEEDSSESLADILKTTLALARVIEKYHNNGYLHLDIKPSNFLVIPETRELVILFDVDSVTAIDDIKSGKVKCVPYSKGWAAPEQMQGKIDKLCQATDIYSIGAILFQKVMGRAVENKDIGIFADWDFDSEMFNKVNPKIKRILKEIFRKTLSVNIKRRFQSIKELIATLETSIEVATQIQYIKSYCPAVDSLFVGRVDELQSINEAFSGGKKCVVIQGHMGMGKSALVKQYAKIYGSTYDNVCWVRLTESWQSESISPDDKLRVQLNSLVMNGDTKENGNSFIKIASSNTLVIVDNYDLDSITEYIKEIVAVGCKVLITTRTLFKNLGDDYHSIQLSGLKENELLDVFEAISGQHYEYTDRLFSFFEDQEFLTYSIILGAGQIKESNITLDEYLDDIYSPEYRENVIYNECDDQVLNHHRRTARLHMLNEDQLEALRTVFVMSYAINEHTTFVESKKGVFDRSVFKAFTNMNLNALNSLIRKRIVNEDEDGELSIHPSIKKLIEDDYTPSCDNCPHLYSHIAERLSFTINQSELLNGNVVDVENGIKHDDDISVVHELFDVYTWLCDSDPHKAKHLYNLFVLLINYDTSQEFWSPEFAENEYWHLEWINREYFVRKLYESINTPVGFELFSGANYIDSEPSCPSYNEECRANLFIIDVCRHMLMEMVDEYYNFTNTLSYLTISISNCIKYIMSKDTNPSVDADVINQLIHLCKPLFYNCLPIFEGGYYVEWFDNVGKYPIAEAVQDPDYYAQSIPLCAWESKTTYLLYRIFNSLLMYCIKNHDVYTSVGSSLDLSKKELTNWSRRMSVQLYRIDKGYNTFFDFYNETPEHYNGSDEVDESLISQNSILLDYGLDDDRSEIYVEEILSTIKRSNKPFYLYALVLDKSFPLSNFAYDYLLDKEFTQSLIQDERLNYRQKEKLFKKAVDQYCSYTEDWDTSDAKRLSSDKCYSISDSGKVVLVDRSDICVETMNHILLLWYQVIYALLPQMKLSKKYLNATIKRVSCQYIESVNSAFDVDLYQEYARKKLSEIPEFACILETKIFVSFSSALPDSRSCEKIVAQSIYDFAFGNKLSFSRKEINGALRTYSRDCPEYKDTILFEILKSL